MDTLKAAQRIDPKSRDLNRALARQYAMQRNSKEAEATLRKILQANPNDLEVRSTWAISSWPRGNSSRPRRSMPR